MASPSAENAFLGAPEEPCLLERALPLALPMSRRALSQRIEDLVDRPVQRVRVVPRVPDESERTAGPQHPVELLRGPLDLEPVEALRDRSRVGRGVRKRDCLRHTFESLHRGHDPLELGPHLGQRLDRDHRRTGREQLARQLAGTCREVDHRAPGPERQPLCEPVDRRLGIVGAGAFV